MLTSNQMLATPASQRVKTNVDSRPTLAKFRRLGLYIILRHNGHDNIDEHMPHSEMLAYATAHEKTLTLDGLVVTNEDYDGFKVAKPREIIEQEKKADKVIQEKRSEYGVSEDAAEKEWDALRKEATELNIDITRMGFEEVVAALVDAKKDMAGGYETLSWPNLKKLAAERGIETHGKKKPEILAALKGD